MQKNVMLVGLGPHSKRIYINYFLKHCFEPLILVDLESNEDSIKKYLLEKGFKKTIVFSLPDKYRDDEELPEEIYKNLLNLCKEKEISYIISSTEPKAHNMYLKFALENDINILSDKPIIVFKGMQQIENIEKLRNKYYELLSLYKKSNSKCFIMCQRQYHRGYIYIKELLRSVIEKYNVPITYIDIYHCDGAWEMPHDLEKENHPYKYGYGKLFHSGYHFIDLLSEFIKLNDLTTDSKRIVKGKMYSDIFTPDDEKTVFNIENYKNIFKKDDLQEPYLSLDNNDYSSYGEKNFYGSMSFYNKDSRLITTANLNLLHFGFSRRGWFESRDYYKENGRIRHERINIQVGPLLNVQIHSYQSKEIKERTNNIDETMTGGLEHYDIDIYRNIDIIGGKPFERIKLRDLYDKELGTDNFIGYNEYSREEFVDAFLNDKAINSDLKNHSLGTEILYSALKTIYDRKRGNTPIEEINIPTKHE